MNILHINTTDNKGGAAQAAYRLHTGLRRAGHSSSMFVARRHGNDPDTILFAPPKDWRSRARRILRRRKIERGIGQYADSRPDGYVHFSSDQSQYNAGLVNQIPNCDVINLHWITRFVDYQTFFSAVPMHRPVVWTLHDMNPFTGGCHYDQGCGRYTEGCGVCPQLGSDDLADLSHQIWERKQRIFDQFPTDRLHFVTPSKWLAEEVKRSPLIGRFPVTVIPNGLDTADFAPRDPALARDVLGVPRDARVIVFIAHNFSARRKGFALLTQALERLDNMSDLFLLSLGHYPSEAAALPAHLHLGYIEQDRLQSLVYSAADIIVIPSIQDNLPNTVLESIACGTPVVGFDVGGIPDMVRPGITGLLAPAQDSEALSAAIVELLYDPGRLAEMSANCRRVAEEEYTLERQTKAYVRLYKALVGQATGLPLKSD